MSSQGGFHSILVPLDGHPLAEQALPVGRQVARRCGATLHLVTVQPPMSPLVHTSDVAAMAGAGSRGSCSAASPTRSCGAAIRRCWSRRYWRTDDPFRAGHGRC